MSDPNLTLYSKFAADKSLAARIGPTFGIMRATEGRFFDAAGVLQTAASGVARFDHNPVTGESLGLLVEEARTNLCLQSETFDAAPWTTLLTPIINKAALAPDGSNNATNLNDNNGAGFEAVVQQISIPDDSADYTFSLFILKTAAGSAPTMGVNIVLIGGTNPGDLPIPRIFTDTGFVQDLQAGANSRIVDAGDHWRLESTVGNNSTGNTIIEIQIYPATAANGFLPNIPQAVGINTVWGAQMETGAFATSYIPTTTVTITRNADVVSTTDLSWFSEAQGTFYTKSKIAAAGIGKQVFEGFSGGGSDRIIIGTDFTGNGSYRASYSVVTIGSQYSIDSSQVLPDSDFIQAAVGYQTDDAAFYVEGTQAGIDALVTTMATDAITTFAVGSDFGGTGQPQVHIAEIRYYNVRKDNTFLESLSNGIINEDSINLSSDLANSIARKIARPY